MTIAGNMTMGIYNSEIREIAHFGGYIIINQSYWYPEDKYTEETAKIAFLNRDSK